ncbi:MAG: DUF6350 family protein, partial [Propionibacteriaceae bacterium]|nr:DUF6350 family protein [Propionibacteriaceae bacterium]
MSSDFSRRRLRNPLRLKVRTADSDREPQDDSAARSTVVLPAWTQATLAGVSAAIAGWLGVCLVVFLSWLTELAGETGPVFGAATQLWLLAHGGGLQLGDVHWTLIPLGLSLPLLLLCRGLTSGFVHRVAMAGPLGRGRLLRLLGLLVVAYALVVTLPALALGSPVQAGRALLGAAILASVGALWGAGGVVDLGLASVVPAWARVIPAAAAAAIWVTLTGGTAVLAISLVLHHARIAAIVDGLGVGPGGMLQLVIAQAAFWPNLVIWATSWVLGGGFTLGDGTVVSPPATELGLIPSIPVLGALPAGAPSQWVLLWLLVGVVAGAAAATVVLRRRPLARLEEVTGLSFLAGLASIVVLLILAVLSRGDLGAARLTGLGPRLAELALLGAPLLTLSAVTVGLVGGVVRQLRGRTTRVATHGETPSGLDPD